MSIAVGEQTYNMALWDLGKPCLTKTDDFCKIMLKNSGKVSRLRPRPNQIPPDDGDQLGVSLVDHWRSYFAS